jgi:hypothetical protein
MQADPAEITSTPIKSSDFKNYFNIIFPSVLKLFVSVR